MINPVAEQAHDPCPVVAEVDTGIPRELATRTIGSPSAKSRSGRPPVWCQRIYRSRLQTNITEGGCIAVGGHVQPQSRGQMGQRVKRVSRVMGP